jgi:CheY-like chemotaxis protein
LSRSSSTQRSILVIDDDALLTGAMEPVLAAEGYTVHVANDNDTALRLLREHDDEIGLVIQDVVRPLGTCLSADHPSWPGMETVPEWVAGLTFYSKYLADDANRRPVVFYSVRCVDDQTAEWIKSHTSTYAIAKGRDPADLIRLLRVVTDQGPREVFRTDDPDPLVITHVRAISDELIAYLARHPESLYELRPRKFEQLVSHLLADMGYDVELTPETWDDGYDIRAVRNDALGRVIYVVECKRFGPNHRVDVGLVRQLCGAKQKAGAHMAVLATTSFFTSSARKYERDLGLELSLKDYGAVCDWLRSYKGTTR